ECKIATEHLSGVSKKCLHDPASFGTLAPTVESGIVGIGRTAAQPDSRLLRQMGVSGPQRMFARNPRPAAHTGRASLVAHQAARERSEIMRCVGSPPIAVQRRSGAPPG